MIFEFLLHICFMDNGCVLETCGEYWFVCFEANEMCGNPFILQQGCVLLRFSFRNYASLFSLLVGFYFSRESGMCPSLGSGKSLALSAVEPKFLSLAWLDKWFALLPSLKRKAMWTYGGSLTCWFSPSQTGTICFPKNENSTCKTISGFCGFRYHWIAYGGAQPL